MSPIRSPFRRRESSQPTLARVEELMEQNRRNPDPEVERRLLNMRHRAFTELDVDGAGGNGNGDAPATGRFAVEQGLPVARREEIDGPGVRAAILEFGCLHIPGLVPPVQAEQLKAGIDSTFEACEIAEAHEAEVASRNGESPQGDQPPTSLSEDAPRSPYYEPFKPMQGYTLGGGRKWNRSGGAIWAADSPRMMFELADTFERLGVRKLVQDYLGERPALSMNKTVLRRARPGKGGADWHQDGAFLGSDIRSLNVWLSLSHCGENAPGMDMVPRRLDGIIETGGEGANFDWSVAPGDAERAAGDAGVVRPLFAPGDVLLFDHLFLHRTASEPTMTDTRYAIESWFFAPSAYPEKQVPIVL